MHLEGLLALAGGADAVVVGPGLGRHPGTLALVNELWQRLPEPAVFDADALFQLDLGRPPAGERVLTPHEGELKRLSGSGALDAGRVAAVRSLAARSRGVALLKGPATLVAQPDGRLSVNTSGNAALATAGSGDVLSGAIAALLAQGADPFSAAGLAAWAHGKAAEAWSARNAGRGLLASDLADQLPQALALAGA
jgi:NAD(P)H-hydrate epimerase